jgi:hypothetical protein
MKRHISVLLCGAAAVFVLSAQTAQAGDTPCDMVMCLGGRVAGESGGSGCSSAEKKYFSIIATKHGKFSPSRTAKERDKELRKCSSGNEDNVSKIGDKFGGARGL